MWNRLIVMCCFCLVFTGGMSSCQRVGIDAVNKINFVRHIGEKRVFFDYDKFDINEASVDVLLDVVKVLQTNPNIEVTVIGHTDNRGSYEYNIVLGEKRADAVKRFMVNCTSYLEDRIKTTSRGEAEPLVYVQDDSKNSKYEKQHARNRRVEFLFSRK